MKLRDMIRDAIAATGLLVLGAGSAFAADGVGEINFGANVTEIGENLCGTSTTCP